MKKVLACLLVVVFLMGSVNVATAASQGSGRGGVMGFIAGCCFGVRAGGAYNDGKEIHWREWVTLLPYVNILFYIWNGIDGANGVSSKDYATKYGAIYY